MNIKLVGTQQNFIVEANTLVTYLNLELPDGTKILAMISDEAYVQVLQALRGPPAAPPPPPPQGAGRTVVFGGDMPPPSSSPVTAPREVSIQEKDDDEDLPPESDDFSDVDEESRPRFGKAVASRSVPEDEHGYPRVAQRAPSMYESDEDGIPSL